MALSFRTAEPHEAAIIVANNIAMAQETEQLALPQDTVERGVAAVLSGTAHATYFLRLQGEEVVAQLMITYVSEPGQDHTARSSSSARAAAAAAPVASGSGSSACQRHPPRPPTTPSCLRSFPQEWSDWRAGVVWWIQSVYCPVQHRRQGHFKALYEHVKAEARAAGAAGLRLYADTGNARAHAAYERLGMTSHYKVSSGGLIERRACMPAGAD